MIFLRQNLLLFIINFSTFILDRNEDAKRAFAWLYGRNKDVREIVDADIKLSRASSMKEDTR